MADISFDFEQDIDSTHLLTSGQGNFEPPDLPAEAIGQQPGNYRKNFRKTVCTYWLRGLCMKGDTCGFLHQFVSDRMPVCRNLLKYGECHDQDCPYKHSTDEIKECNMYKLGFCIYGPQCRYKHIKIAGPPPPPEEVEAAKPRDARNINVVVNQANPGVARDDERPAKRSRPFGGRDRERERDRRPLALPAPPPGLPPDAVGRGGDQGGGKGRPDGGSRGAGRGGRDRDRGRGGMGGGQDVWRGGNDDQQQQHQQQHQQQQQGGAPLGMPPLAGVLAPSMPGIMAPAGGPTGPMPPMQPPPFDPAMFAAMAGQGFFPRPF